MEIPLERRLAAILAADVVGYSRLIGADETGTLAALRSLLKEIVQPTLKRHRGRIVKLMGDGLLAEFASVVDAVAAAVEIQEAAAKRSMTLPEDGRIALRIGVNMGDVAVEDGDLFGDGVNIAARLQEIAAPNGVAVSDDAYRQLGGRLELPFEDTGEKTLKNIKQLVRVWLWPSTKTPASQVALATPHSLPDRPSIAVLPFVNMSDDPNQEYFADGMTEDIITGLAWFRSLVVTARNSSFSYKGKSPDVRQVARELGVRYILEGSVRAGGGRIRITGQLVDADTGAHLWAERYDRDLDDIFNVQDEVTEAIVAAIAPEIDDVERERAQRKPPESLDAWDLYQHGLAAYYSSTNAGLQAAIEQFDKVIEIDPTFALAYAMAANARSRYALHSLPENRTEVLKQASEMARQGVALDSKNAICLWTDGRVHSMLGRHDVAIRKIKEAIELNPNDAMSHYFLGYALCRAGRAEEAIPHIDHAMRLSPRDIYSPAFFAYRAVILFDLARYDEALEWARRARLSPNPRTLTFAIFAAALSQLGRRDEAKIAIQDLLAHAPAITYGEYRNNPVGSLEAMERLSEALREAGLPE
jgi:adenylate cyclase